MSWRRRSVFTRPECLDSHKALLDEVAIWGKWEDPLPLDLACKVYAAMLRRAKPPYTGLELQFLRFFERNCTPRLVARFLADAK